MSNTHNCKVSGKPFVVTEDDTAFYDKMGVSVPTLCPDERRRRRMAWATFRTLYHRKCDATGKSILSMFATDAKHPVYHSDYWWSDEWDACEFGRNVDFSRPFFEQFDDLFRQVPVLHQSVIHSENCEYINMAGHCKNCYLSFYLDYCEDCYYVQEANSCRSCVDCLGIMHSELCYECLDCTNCYELLFSKRCVNCHSSYFLTDCRGCDHCIGCFNLANKSYYVFNKKVLPAEFEKLRQQLSSASKIRELKDHVISASPKFPKKYYFGHSNEAFSGDNVRNVRNSYYCFHCHELENVKFADYFFEVHNSMDVSIYGNKSEWLYNCLKTGDQCSNNLCCLCCWTGSCNNAYCHLVISTKDCFGCSALRHKQYCILNRPYTRHEYDRLREKIIAHMKETGEWGEFFPMQMSPFAYNESVAQEYFPLTKQEAVGQGLRWRDEEAGEQVGPVEVSKESQSVCIDDVRDDVLREILQCADTGKGFRVVKPELEFYRRMQIPLPCICPEQRHLERKNLRNPRTLWKRSCADCGAGIDTSYPPSSPERVLCEPCYLAIIE